MNVKQSNSSDQYKKLKWACRRGMLELDLLLNAFLEQAFPQLSLKDQGGFIALLALPDPLLFAWLLGQDSPDDINFNKIVKMIRENANKKL